MSKINPTLKQLLHLDNWKVQLQQLCSELSKMTFTVIEAEIHPTQSMWRMNEANPDGIDEEYSKFELFPYEVIQGIDRKVIEDRLEKYVFLHIDKENTKELSFLRGNPHTITGHYRFAWVARVMSRLENIHGAPTEPREAVEDYWNTLEEHLYEDEPLYTT
jgi:hypothetical protein